jgi:hypothetical protein
MHSTLWAGLDRGSCFRLRRSNKQGSMKKNRWAMGNLHPPISSLSSISNLLNRSFFIVYILYVPVPWSIHLISYHLLTLPHGRIRSFEYSSLSPLHTFNPVERPSTAELTPSHPLHSFHSFQLSSAVLTQLSSASLHFKHDSTSPPPPPSAVHTS